MQRGKNWLPEKIWGLIGCRSEAASFRLVPALIVKTIPALPAYGKHIDKYWQVKP